MSFFVSYEWSSGVQYSTFDKCLWQWIVCVKYQRVYMCYYSVVGLHVFIRVIFTRGGVRTLAEVDALFVDALTQQVVAGLN